MGTDETLTSLPELETSSGRNRGGTLLCAPLTGATVDLMLSQMRKAEKIGADVVEVRLDLLEQFSPRRDLKILVDESPLPTIVTCRPIWEGGKFEGGEKTRQDTLRLAVELGAHYIDIELMVAEEFMRSITRKKHKGLKIIVSSHNFHNTPSTETIGDLVAQMQAAGADIVKIVTTALDITDCASIFRIMAHSQVNPQSGVWMRSVSNSSTVDMRLESMISCLLHKVPMIGLAMGERGLISHILGPKFGGYMTYGAIEAGAGLAPGQPTAQNLLDLYNLRLIRSDTKVFGNVGNPISHSKSPLMYNAAFRSVGFNGVYLHFLVDDVPKFFTTYSSLDFASGCSCTMPYKESAIEVMDEMDPIAKKIGAINHIMRKHDGKLRGYNTDHFGAISAIEDGLRGMNGVVHGGVSPLAGKLVVVLGAGGAGKAVAFGAADKGARVVVANRTLEKAKDLADKVGGQAMLISEVEHFHPEEGMVLANTTSVGLRPNINDTPIPKHALKHYCLVFDAIYTPKDTRLLRESKEAGAVIVSGTEMLIRQAFAQYTNFTGLPAPEELFRELIEKNT